jgi:hypothetical protein
LTNLIEKTVAWVDGTGSGVEKWAIFKATYRVPINAYALPFFQNFQVNPPEISCEVESLAMAAA